MNKNFIVVLDYETGGKFYWECPVLSVAALVLHPRTLEPVRDNEGKLEEFYSLMRPPTEELPKIEQDALAVNKITMDEVMAAPEQAQVWKTLVNFVKRFNKGNVFWDYPVMAGFNIGRFDWPITERLCRKYDQINKKTGEQNLFHPRDYLDVMNVGLWWFESTPEVKSYSLDNWRKFFGMPTDRDALVGETLQAHHALRDVRDTAALLRKFVNLKRSLQSKYGIKFAGAFSDKQE